jgi:hypothetical protein
VETGRIAVESQPRQKVHETPISTNSWEWWPISDIQEAETGGIVVLGQPGQKVYEILSQQKKLGMVGHTCHLSCCGKHRRVVVHASPRKKLDLISRITRVKMTGGVAQVVEYFPSNF